MLRNDEMAGMRELFDRMAGTGRLLNHTVVRPKQGEIEHMAAWAEAYGPIGWKVYTLGEMDAEHETFMPGSGWRLDDDETGLAFLGEAQRLGISLVCAHKGVSGLVECSAPDDVGPGRACLSRHRLPDLPLRLRAGTTRGPLRRERAHSRDRTLIRSLADHGLGPGDNVYAELGTTWFNLLSRPDEAAHVLGKLLVHLGEDNIIWGTDGIWYGPTQPAIDAFRAFQIPDELCERVRLPEAHAHRPAQDPQRQRHQGLWDGRRRSGFREGRPTTSRGSTRCSPSTAATASCPTRRADCRARFTAYDSTEGTYEARGSPMGTADVTGRPYALISTDCHAGADLWDYRPYLEQRWHEEFDAWARDFSDPWGEVDPDSDYKAGVSSFMSPISWDSPARLEMLDAQGVVAEVLFPNTAQPFYPSGSLTAPGPRTPEEYERRWAGVQAHNRWLRDFCDAAPGRRIGLVQLFVDDVEAAIAEVRWAKEAGLKGVLLPPDHHLTIQNLYYSELDPLWAVCAELEMPIHRHANAPSSDEGGAASRAAARAIGVHESYYFGRRSLFQLVLAGVFERFADLKFVLTEVGGSAWVLRELAALDRLVTGANDDGTINAMFAAPAVDMLSLTPT